MNCESTKGVNSVLSLLGHLPRAGSASRSCWARFFRWLQCPAARMTMQIITCNQCGQQVEPQKQSTEYTVKEVNGARIYVLSKMTFTFDCPTCGNRVQEEPVEIE